ncbi:hypothetical protein NIES4103_66400 [Nostoc sp. NIES-4103]|nr:hypothetical protein NIES4103_66400 [Nostoc sp. NIES-4103]
MGKGEYVAKQKQKQADELLEQLTRMDAHLIDVLSKDVVKPLSDFVDDAFEALVVRNDVGAAKTVHDTFRQKMKPIFNSVEETLQQLEEAAQNFYRRELKSGQQAIVSCSRFWGLEAPPGARLCWAGLLTPSNTCSVKSSLFPVKR